jgi:hypothetical protein
MRSLKTFHSVVEIENSTCIEILENLPKTWNLIFLTEIDNNNSIINALINGNGKYLQELDISYTNYFDGNELMRQKTVCCFKNFWFSKF